MGHILPQLIDTRPATQGPQWHCNAESISTAFTKACKLPGIDDPHFHDLRHEGISRLFEVGWALQDRCAIQPGRPA